MSFLHAPALEAGAVTTIPPLSLSGRGLAMISQIHLATRVEDVKRDEKGDVCVWAQPEEPGDDGGSLLRAGVHLRRDAE